MLTVGNYKTAPRASNQMSAVALRWDCINIRWCMCRCRARRPQQHPLRWRELRSTLSHQQRTSSWINESFRSKWTLHTGKNKYFYAIDCGAQLKNLFIQLACPCPVSSTLNYILEVKFVIRLELTKSVLAAHASESRHGASEEPFERLGPFKTGKPATDPGVIPAKSVWMQRFSDPAQILQYLNSRSPLWDSNSVTSFIVCCDCSSFQTQVQEKLWVNVHKARKQISILVINFFYFFLAKMRKGLLDDSCVILKIQNKPK